MNRRKFIKNSGLAATLVGISPALFTEPNKSNFRKKALFILRGVAYVDALNAFKKFNISADLSFHIQKTNCINLSYSHGEGLESLIGTVPGKKNNLLQSQLLDRYLIPEIIKDALTNSSSEINPIYLHHTEIGHSSTDAYIEYLEEFFIELGKYFNPYLHKVIVTADIGRNEMANSNGGKDHSNPSSLETFALFLGGEASKLGAKNKTLNLNEVLKQKF